MADAPKFDPTSLTTTAADALTVRRVYGEAYERGGATVIPVARVWGATGTGAGGGEGEGEGDGGLPIGLWAQRSGLGRFRPGAAARVTASADDDATELATDEGSADLASDDQHGDHTHGHGHGHGSGSGHGGGGGFAVHVRAVGVYVIDDRGVHWRPAVDVNRVILGGQAVAATAVAALGFAVAVKAASSAVSKSIASIANAIALR
ncbi:hypothetical protein [Cellulomonas alba]|uniref:Uncharacterized protein n=1 Tax=Cellulomonas alba TaxID=3053467 RepID=A0ABT7SJ64_9CELL|nr:hypothetical protein [Cellulomonas alba]MDM7856221.1 hypothetical protein [Cellulomonas alba]